MDPRRQLSGAALAAAGLLTLLAPGTSQAAAAASRPPVADAAAGRSGPKGRPLKAPATGPDAIAAANQEARARSEARRFVGGVQVFAYEPGRIYEVWTAPLRVTALTLAPAESLVALAAGDTVRWQIGETASGAGAERRVHVLVKPMARDLETNLVITTSQRLYFVQLRSGAEAAANAAVTWDIPPPPPPEPGPPPPQSASPPAGPVLGDLDARYRIRPRGRRPAWTPMAVMTDGRRTYIAFPVDLDAQAAPALFALDGEGRAQLVNYRQQGGLYVADQVLARAELRLGAGRPQVVRLTRLPEDRP